jgi:hypothetical protein
MRTSHLYRFFITLCLALGFSASVPVASNVASLVANASAAAPSNATGTSNNASAAAMPSALPSPSWRRGTPRLKIRTGVNHLALKSKSYLAALKTAYQELVKLEPISLGA